jgi:hypothetical protein
MRVDAVVDPAVVLRARNAAHAAQNTDRRHPATLGAVTSDQRDCLDVCRTLH